ncbi:uncharacterized protein STEHIDRAFT_165030 [Stereum hirsutum FP-91666 SS1]|uniref:uncharacterized protein n=1 Tax=Stereum hirsutum (strain FP-91666) TaxID=721885 RepID=UPI000440AF70|nr:uncharacterized protein STEHIDRAFT_165030 [Stereum hirsutum FP-91666 SS1]EIM92819.1 hypothetical protein STEHIDRAFT_165030 [Stereum hirsutum FP-91666 SS1]
MRPPINESVLSFPARAIRSLLSVGQDVDASRSIRNDAPTPVLRLPPEILGYVFQFLPSRWTVTEYDRGWNANYSVARTGRVTRFFVLSHVCRTWRDTAIGTPNLWEDMFVPPPPAYVHRQGRSSTVLRGRNYDITEPKLWLDFDFWGSSFYTPSMEAVIQRSISTIPTLKSYELWGAGARYFLEHAQQRAPELYQLNLIGTQHSVPPTIPKTMLAGDAPNLRELRLLFLTIPPTLTLLRGLEILEIHGGSMMGGTRPLTKWPLEEWLEALGNMPRLHTVVLAEVIDTQRKSHDPGPSTVIDLPSLVSMSLEIDSLVTCARLLCRIDLPPRALVRFTCYDPHISRSLLAGRKAFTSAPNALQSAIESLTILAQPPNKEMNMYFQTAQNEIRFDLWNLRRSEFPLAFVPPSNSVEVSRVITGQRCTSNFLKCDICMSTMQNGAILLAL